ncbi:MAG: hypothetical protein GF401_01890 [Chitinivibrionales bacterium]|nr:hypothetical protein [Chitinivibrionales bacterium]
MQDQMFDHGKKSKVFCPNLRMVRANLPELLKMEKITVDCSQTVAPFNHFWRSTGFIGGHKLFRDEYRQNIALIGSIPRKGIEFVRIHNMLDLVFVDNLDSEEPVYEWTFLDRAIGVLVDNGLKPFFELMGNPHPLKAAARYINPAVDDPAERFKTALMGLEPPGGEGIFSDFTDKRQLYMWRRLIKGLGSHCVEQFGEDEVVSWYFESWNEPDCPAWWRQFWENPQSLCHYYDACSEGLFEAHPGLRLGGPGGQGNLNDTTKAFLAHCDGGTNYFTGEKGVRLDFISFHEKGAMHCLEDIDPDSMGMCQREMNFVQYVRDNHPRLADVPVMNNECDPQIGFGAVHTWRALPYYPAFVAKMINQHQVLLIDKLKCSYELLGNDNGFTGRWGHRTLCARFGSADEVDHGAFVMVKKPIFNLMVGLTLLGDERCMVTHNFDPSSRLGILATKAGNGQIALMLYNSRDKIYSDGEDEIEIMLTGISFDTAMLTHYRIDDSHSNPFRIYVQKGVRPDCRPDDLVAIRAAQELEYLEEPQEIEIKKGCLKIEVTLPLPSVSIILLSKKPQEKPDKITGLQADRYKGLVDINTTFTATCAESRESAPAVDTEEILLRWDSIDSRTIRTYEVLQSEKKDGPFSRVNKQNILCSSYILPRPKRNTCYYKIRAVDCWGRAGEESEIIHV